MRFLADEDFPKPLVVKIRNLGFSVKTIQQKNLQGSSDEIVTNIAIKEHLILLTFDKDFIEKVPKNLRAVIFRFPKTSTFEIIPLIEGFLADLKQKSTAKINVFKFSKLGLEIIK